MSLRFLYFYLLDEVCRAPGHVFGIKNLIQTMSLVIMDVSVDN
jgi:hypothetical protein